MFLAVLRFMLMFPRSAGFLFFLLYFFPVPDSFLESGAESEPRVVQYLKLSGASSSVAEPELFRQAPTLG